MQLKIVQRHNFNFWNFSCHKIKKKRKNLEVGNKINQPLIWNYQQFLKKQMTRKRILRKDVS